MEKNKPVTLPPENGHLDRKFIEQHLHTSTQFLMQTGIEKKKAPSIACAILGKVKHSSADFIKITDAEVYRSLYLFLQNDTAISESRPETDEMFLSLQEDIELHDAIQQLALKERAVIALSFFHLQPAGSISKILQEEPEVIVLTQKNAIRSLKELLAEKDHYELSDDQMKKSLSFLRKSYTSVPLPPAGTVIDEINKEVPQNGSLVKKTPNRWIRIAGAAIALPIVLIYSFSFIDGKGSQDSSSQTESSMSTSPELPEEKINELTNEFNEKLDLLSTSLGITVEETRSLEFVKQAESQLDHFQSINEIDEPHENKQEVIDNFDVYKEHILLELSTPLDTFSTTADIVTGYGGNGSLEKSDILTHILHVRLTEVQRVYTEKLNNGQDNTTDIVPSIRENGFDIHYDQDQSAHIVHPGGDYLEEAIASLHPVYRDYLLNAFSYPYVENDKLTFAYEEVPYTLLKMENFLKEMSAGEAEGMMVYDQLAAEYSQLLNHFIFGSISEPVYENGLLKEEIKAVWEKILDERDREDYQFVRAVEDQYHLLSRKDFKQETMTADRQVKTSYTPEWFDQSEDISQFAIPLEGELSEQFTVFQQDYSTEVPRHLTATEVVLFYLHALFLGDANAVYSLLSEEPGLPARDDFVNDQNNAFRSIQQPGPVTDIFIESSTREGSIVRLMYENGSTRKIELVEQEDGMKIKFDEKNLLQ